MKHRRARVAAGSPWVPISSVASRAVPSSVTRRFLLLLGFIAGCAAIEPDPLPLPVFAEPPERPYRALERIEVAGRVNEPLAEVYEALRGRAREAGADPGARPELLEDPFRAGAFPYEGSGVRTVAGFYWGGGGARRGLRGSALSLS